jgi:hypothetical protein
MINNEVPTASFIDDFAKNSKDGIIKNPPPAPKKPVTNPIEKPIIAKFL